MFKSVLNIFLFVFRHPLTRGKSLRAISRIFFWQLGIRLLKMPVVVPWVNNTRLVVGKGMAGATGNYYCGLHEFCDMSFVLHYLRRGDLFVDIGANVGTYSILAAGCAGANVISVEPIPETYLRLCDNVNLNNLHALVDLKNIGLGSGSGWLRFSSELDAENHVISEAEKSNIDSISVPVDTLDNMIGDRCPLMIKIDVEGFETEVLRGGDNTFRSKGLEAVLIEFNNSGERYGYSELDLRKKFSQLGFIPCAYDPFQRAIKRLDDDFCTSGNTLYLRNYENASERVKNSNAFTVLEQVI